MIINQNATELQPLPMKSKGKNSFIKKKRVKTLISKHYNDQGVHGFKHRESSELRHSKTYPIMFSILIFGCTPGKPISYALLTIKPFNHRINVLQEPQG